MGIIRLLLAIAVLNSHHTVIDLPLVDGHEAVLAFFAISGFYMALILDTKYTSTKHFYLCRFLTLYPMYLFALTWSIGLVISLDIHPMTSSAELSMLLSDPLAFLVMIWTSVCLVGQELLFCLANPASGDLEFVTASRDAIWRHAPLIQAWSLSLEILFYILAPFLVTLRTRKIGLLIGASLILKFAVILAGGNNIVFFKRFFLTEFWLFAGGILSYRFSVKLPKGTRHVDLLAFTGLTLCIAFADAIPESLQPFALPGMTLLAMPFIFRGFRQFPLDRLVGKMSYPFYLIHFSIIAIFEECYDEPIGWNILLATLVAAMVIHSLFAPGTEMLKRKTRFIFAKENSKEMNVAFSLDS